MASQKQLEANRRNARKSTGPNTPEGKAIASANSLKHGLCSERVLVPGEDAEEFAQFRRELLAELMDASALESVFTERVVLAAWRLRRVTRMEAEMIAHEGRSWSGLSSKDRTLGEKFGEALTCNDKYPRLWRYESQLDLALHRALHELERLQAARRGDAPPAPVAIDVNVSGAGNLG